MNVSTVLRPLGRTSLRLPCLFPNSAFFCATSSPEVGSKKFFEEAVSKNKVVVFMKGVPDAPKCGFSNAVAQILRMHGVKYDSYDVLADERVRQGNNLAFQVFFNYYFLRDIQLLFISLRCEGVFQLANHPSSIHRRGVCGWM